MWLSENDVYLQWLDQRQGLLWIKGKPGAGKSTLLRHTITTTEKQRSQNKPIVASFFFHGRGALIQKSPLGLFRSLLHQILQRIPELLLIFSSLFKEKCSTEGEFGRKWERQERDLEDFFRDRITHAAMTNPTTIYVDALDECGEEIATRLVAFFQVITSDAPISICFSCRHYPLISLDNGLEICVEDENHQDIEYYTQAMIKGRIKPDKYRKSDSGVISEQISRSFNG